MEAPKTALSEPSGVLVLEPDGAPKRDLGSPDGAVGAPPPKAEVAPLKPTPPPPKRLFAGAAPGPAVDAALGAEAAGNTAPLFPKRLPPPLLPPQAGLEGESLPKSDDAPNPAGLPLHYLLRKQA